MNLPKAIQLMDRPHLITPDGARHWGARLHAFDPRAFERRNPLGLMQRVASLVGNRPAAMDDDDREPPKQPTRPAAYAPMWLGKPDGETEFGWTLKDGVALMSIDTPLMENGFGFCGTWFHGYDSIEAAIREADEDDRVKAMFIRWDSPGGVVAPGIYELAAMLQGRGRAAKEGAKPIHSFCDLAASAAYWVPAQTDHLVAPNVGIVGSIGAVWTHCSAAGYYEKTGLKITPVQFGKFKTSGADYRDMTEEELGHMQAVIDDLGEDFLAAVEAGRGAKLTAEKARETEARVFQAQHRNPEHSGLARGFVDAIATQRDAFGALVAETRKGSFLPLPSGSTAAQAALPPALPGSTAAAAAPTMETDMKLRAALLAAFSKPDAKSDTETLQEIRKLVNESEDDEAEAEVADEETDDEETPPEDDKPDARAPKAKPAATVDPAVAQAVLALPEAKGREKLAQRLAFKPGMTVEEAKADLLAAPKSSRLADHVTDPNLSAGGADDKRSEAQKVAHEALAFAGLLPKSK